MARPKTKEWTEEENKALLEFMEEGRKKRHASPLSL